MTDLAKASREFFLQVNGGAVAYEFELTPEFVKTVEAIREQIREDERGGGMCHLVTDELCAMNKGWERMYVSYLTDEGEVICGGGHAINVLPDGSILDPTRDQFGEGFSVSHIKTGSDEIGRYRPEFYEDYHPGHPEHPELAAWLPFYEGTDDSKLHDTIKKSKARGHWLQDLTLLDEYEAKQRGYCASGYAF
jgi:hypothetical protein